MKYYRFGNPEGRFIGNTEKFSVYEKVIAERQQDAMEDNYRILPGEFTFAYGPATGGMLESVAFDIHTPGEMIKRVDVYPHYKERKVKVRGLIPSDALMIIERINGFHAVSNAISFELAVEDALGLYVPDKVQYSRIVMLELERMRSNLEVVKRLCESAGFGVPQNQIAYLTENVSRIISKISGHRYFFSASSIGGCNIQLNSIESMVSIVKEQFSEIFRDLLQSKIFLNRLQNNGVVNSGYLIGPAARAAGLEIDARLAGSPLPYSDLDFRPYIFDEPDAFGRFYVRSQEILQSASLIIEAAKRSGNAEPQNVENGNGEGAVRIESPQGDLFYYVRIDGGRIEDLQICSPSSMNIDAFKRSMVGNIFTDFHFNWESFGIWISEMVVII